MNGHGKSIRSGDRTGRHSYLRQLEPDASLEHIRAIFDERIKPMSETGDNTGCMIAHTAVELAPHDKKIRDMLLSGGNAMASGKEDAVFSAGSEGLHRESQRPRRRMQSIGRQCRPHFC